MWIEHGGSGLGLSFAEANDLDFSDAILLVEQMRERKKLEGDAIKSAQRKR